VTACAGTAKEPITLPAPPTSTSVQDTLWSLAPDGVNAAAVISPAGLAAREGMIRALQRIIESAPDMSELAAKVKADTGPLWSTEASTSAGFAVLNLAPILREIAADPKPLGTGVTNETLIQSFAGPLSIIAAPASTHAEARLPLGDTAPATALVEHCTEIPELG